MQSWSSKDFTADRAWGALDIANFSGTTVRLHWTDQPYIWHINDGQEVFAVMDGQVAMHVKVDGEEQIIMLNAGDILLRPGWDASMSPTRRGRRVFW